MTWEEIEKLNLDNRKAITEEATRDQGKFVKMWGSDRAALLLGVIDGYYDLYWVAMDCRDMNVFFESCVGGYDVLEGELPPETTVLKWMQDNDADGLLERVKSNMHLENNEKFLVDIKVK